MFWRVVLLWLLNLWDAGATYYVVYIKHLEEANPLMDKLLGMSPYVFLAFKVIYGTVLALILLYINKHWLIRWTTNSALTIYALLGILHLVMLIWVL